MANPKTNISIEQFLQQSPWVNFEEHLDDLRERIDDSINLSNGLRTKYREELLTRNPGLKDNIKRL